MKKNIFSSVSLVLLSFCLFMLNCSGSKIKLGDYQYKEPAQNKIVNTETWGYIPVNQIGIILKEDLGRKDAEKIANEINGKVVGEIEYINLYQIENNSSTGEELTAAIGKVSKLEGVEYAFPNSSVYPSGPENSGCNPLDDPVYSGDNGKPFEMIGLKNAWDIIKASKVKLHTVKVGVNDEALGTKSEEITGEAGIAGDGEADLNKQTDLSHSNAVVNIIGANSGNGGVSGVASILGKELNINVINTVNTPGDLYTETKLDTNDITQARWGNKGYAIKTIVDLQRQIESGSKIINCSIGMRSSDNLGPLAAAMKKFFLKINKEHPDIIFVASANNYHEELNGSNNMFGLKVPNLITVGALDREGEAAGYSSFGNHGEVEISACGKNMVEVGKNWQGTSFTAPQVSAVIAIMKSINPDLKADEIKKIIIETGSTTVNGKQVPQNLGGRCLRADDAILRVINDLRKKDGKQPLTKEDLLNLSNLGLKSSGGPKDFKITASVKSVFPDDGTPLEIDVAGGNFLLDGDKVKTLSSPGDATWTVTKPDNETILTVKVTRLDAGNCKTILLTSLIEAKDLAGQWNGTVVAESWSASSDLIRKYAAGTIEPEMGKVKTLTLDVTYKSEGSVGIALYVKGGKPIPTQTFSFNDGKLHSEFSMHMYKYTYNAAVTRQGNRIELSGTWSSNSGMINMSGTWSAGLDTE